MLQHHYMPAVSCKDLLHSSADYLTIIGVRTETVEKHVNILLHDCPLKKECPIMGALANLFPLCDLVADLQPGRTFSSAAFTSWTTKLPTSRQNLRHPRMSRSSAISTFSCQEKNQFAALAVVEEIPTKISLELLQLTSPKNVRYKNGIIGIPFHIQVTSS